MRISGMMMHATIAAKTHCAMISFRRFLRVNRVSPNCATGCASAGMFILECASPLALWKACASLRCNDWKAAGDCRSPKARTIHARVVLSACSFFADAFDHEVGDEIHD